MHDVVLVQRLCFRSRQKRASCMDQVQTTEAWWLRGYWGRFMFVKLGFDHYQDGPSVAIKKMFVNFYNRVRDMLSGSRMQITSLFGKAANCNGTSLRAEASL